MTLRCKKGDMAVILKPHPRASGKWVESDKSLLPIRPGDLDEKEETERELTV